MKRVLFVDDEPDYINIMRHFFSNGEIEPTFAYTATEGLEELKKHQFDAVVIDLMMFIDGVLFLRLANGRLKGSKVYFLSALDKQLAEEIIEPVKNRVAGVYSKDQIENLKYELMK